MSDVNTAVGNDPAATLATQTLTKEQIKAIQDAKLAKVKADFAAKNALVDVTPVDFFFKTIKEKDSAGKETGIETKRPTIELVIPRPSLEGLVTILGDPETKEFSLVFDALEAIVIDRARDLLNDDPSLTADNFPYGELIFSTIANLPPGEGRGRSGISKETYEEFVADYMLVMPSVTGKPAETVKKSAVLFGQKFAPVKTNKAVLAKLQTYLAMYTENTKNGEQFATVIDFLAKKLVELLSKDEQQVADAL